MSSTIKNRVIEQIENLPADLQQQVLIFIKSLQIKEQKGVAGKQLLDFAGGITLNDLKLMQKEIEEGCEKVDLHEW
uniref:DUF2281 domain-containing protein n=1 Tax=Chlorobium phaeobacteroides (strain BS1) TaxID=331678 RepID=B3ELY1_CHLPB